MAHDYKHEQVGRPLPFHAPAYGATWAFKTIRRLSVVCEATPESLARLVEYTPFEVVGSRFEVFHDDLIQHTLGPLRESGICIPVRYEQFTGFFHAVMFVTSDVALMAGREVLGYPKLMGEVSFDQIGEQITVRTKREGRLVFKADFTPSVGDSNPVPTANPDWSGEGPEWSHHLLLKSIPSAEQPGADVFNVIYRQLEPGEVLVSSGELNVEFGNVAELAGLGESAVVGGYLSEADFTSWKETRHVVSQLRGFVPIAVAGK